MYEERGVKFVVLRNYAGLPDVLVGTTDVDILIDRTRFKESEKIFQELMHRYNVNIQQVIFHQHCKQYRFFKVDAEYEFFLQMDIHVDELWYGASYLTGEEILTHRRRFRSFWVPAKHHEAIISWLSSLLAGGFIKEKHIPRICAVVQQQPEQIRKWLELTCSKHLAEQLFELLSQGDIQATVRYRHQLRRQIWWRWFRRHPLKLLCNTSIAIFYNCLRRLVPNGMWVAIIGPDGSGKSTLLQHLKPLLDQAFPSDANKIGHLRPGWLPRLRSLLSMKKDTEELREVVEPHGAAPSGKFGSVFRLFYHLVDYIFGYFPQIRWHLVRNAIVLFDRYYYDLIIDPYRARIHLPGWFLKIWLHFIPQPDLVIYLDCSPEELYFRKKELTKKELIHQVAAYRRLMRSLPNGIVVGGHQPIEDVVQEVLQTILNYKSKQFRRMIKWPWWKTGVVK